MRVSDAGTYADGRNAKWIICGNAQRSGDRYARSQLLDGHFSPLQGPYGSHSPRFQSRPWHVSERSARKATRGGTRVLLIPVVPVPGRVLSQTCQRCQVGKGRAATDEDCRGATSGEGGFGPRGSKGGTFRAARFAAFWPARRPREISGRIPRGLRSWLQTTGRATAFAEPDLLPTPRAEADRHPIGCAGSAKPIIFCAATPFMTSARLSMLRRAAKVTSIFRRRKRNHGGDHRLLVIRQCLTVT
jgi:hypothetical protein